MLEGIIKDQAKTIQKLDETQDERLEELISPPAYSWMKEGRESASENNEASDEDVEKLGKGPGPGKGGWLSDATNTEAVEPVAA